MRSSTFYLVAITCFTLSAHAQTKVDEAAVRDVPQKFVAAWAKHDGHELAKIMAPNVDFVNVGGDWLQSRPNFELYHTRLLSGVFKQSSLKVLDSAVSFMRPDLAILHWTWVITGDGMENLTTHEPR